MDADEWGSIYYFELEGKAKQKRDWTIMFNNKLSKVYPMCVLCSRTIGLANILAVRLIRRTFEHVLNANSIIVIDLIFIPAVLIVRKLSQYSLYTWHAFVTTFRWRKYSCSSCIRRILQSTSVTKHFHKQFSIRIRE